MWHCPDFRSQPALMHGSDKGNPSNVWQGPQIIHNGRIWVLQKKLDFIARAWLGRGPINKLMPQLLCPESPSVWPGLWLSTWPPHSTAPTGLSSGSSNWWQVLQPHPSTQVGPCFLSSPWPKSPKLMGKESELSLPLSYKSLGAVCGQKRGRSLSQAQTYKVLCAGNSTKKIAFDLFVQTDLQTWMGTFFKITLPST